VTAPAGAARGPRLARALLAGLVAMAVAGFGHAQQRPGLAPGQVADAWLAPPSTHALVARGDQAIRPLAAIDAERAEALADVIADARRLVERHAVLGLLLLDADGSVVFEAYKDGASARSLMLGYSMSKSATSVAVGQALCDGLLASLDDEAGRYAQMLAGTAYGAASLRELLTMASAGRKPGFAGQAEPGFTGALLRQRTRSIREGFARYGSEDGLGSTPGVFEYKAFDTYALGVAVSSAAGEPFHAYFAKTVWQRIGAEADAAWLTDRNGDTANAEGFGARLRDWARLALYVRDRRARGEGDCLGRYLAEATSARIANASGRVAPAFAAYGYQFWTGNRRTRADAFWMVGYGGQRVGVDPSSGRVIALAAHEEGFMPEVYALFDRWIRK